MSETKRTASHTSAAAPGEAHGAPAPSATNRTAPVQEACAAVEATSGAEAEALAGGSAYDSAGGVATGAGIAGIAATPGATHRGAEPPTRSAPRIVLHVDIDAFFAAIEQRRNPGLRGKPVIVGAGVIASCSYEARRFGLRAGMRLSEARRLCPQVVILEGHAHVYRCFAEEIFAHCRRLAPEVETYLDEAYCDLTGTERLHGDLLESVRGLKRAILETAGLTVTCGIGPNRMLAKLIGKTVKPDGLARIEARDADAFLCDRPIEQLAGVGHAYARTLRSMNLCTIGELRQLPVEVLAALFGANGRLLHERCRGRDTAPVSEREIPLTISRETSFHRDTADRAEIEGMLEYLVGRACRTAREIEIRPRTVAVHVRYCDGQGDGHARSLAQASDTDPVVLAPALDLLRRLFTRRVALHAVGVTLSNFSRAGADQGSLFDEREAGRRAALFRAFDGVRRAYGHGVLVSGRALHLKGRLEEDLHGFVLRTPSLTK
jgi:DNA polymerase-4